MVSLETPICDFGQIAIDFTLPGVDGKDWSLSSCVGDKGLLVMFICNHCPYVKAVLSRLIRDTQELKTLGINSVAIMSNDQNQHEQDSFENMRKISESNNFCFPYLLDETQQIAKSYGAVCTPDFFGFNQQLELQYRGRLDESRKQTAPEGVKRDLFEAMSDIAKTGKGPQNQISSMGCSIKWRDD